jgi:hypothetical protein
VPEQVGLRFRLEEEDFELHGDVPASSPKNVRARVNDVAVSGVLVTFAGSNDLKERRSSYP